MHNYQPQQGYKPPQGYQHPEQRQQQQSYPAPQQHQQAQQGSNGIVERYSSVFPEFFSIKAHGKKAAFEIKPAITKANWHTVMLEAANASGVRQFDWGTKSTIQVTRTELLEVVGVLLGIFESTEGKLHGPQKNKAFTLRWQTNGQVSSLFASIIEGGKNAKGVPIPYFEAIQMGHLAAIQYCANFPSLTVADLIATLKR